MANKKSGFTTIELMIAATVSLLAFAVFLYVSFTIQDNIAITSATLGISEKGRFAIDRISKDIREAESVISSHGIYITDDDTIVLQVPSIDANGDIIDPDVYFDYIIFALDSTYPERLLRIVDAEAVSSRSNIAETVSQSIDTLSFSSEGAGLSYVTDKQSIKTVTVKIVTSAISGSSSRQNEIMTSASLRNK